MQSVVIPCHLQTVHVAIYCTCHDYFYDGST